MNNGIKLVIFDLDGTLMDAYEAVCSSVNHTMERMGMASVSDDVIRRTVGWGDSHLVEQFVGRDRLDEALAVYREHHAGALLTGTKLLPGAGELLAYLKAHGYRMAVASNRPTKFSCIAIEHLGIGPYFDFVLCGDAAARPKPHGDILREVLTHFGLGPEQAVYVGDMGVDVETGKNAGVRTVAVTTGSSSSAELAALSPWKTVGRVDEVIGILRDEAAQG